MSYSNTKPLVYGFENGMMQEEVTLSFNYPSKLAAQLLNDEVDVGLIPVAAIPNIPQAHIISDYCIGASQAVASVCLFSDVPIDQIKEILVDYQSRTSAALLKILLRDFWHIAPASFDPGCNQCFGYSSDAYHNQQKLIHLLSLPDDLILQP